MFKWVKNNQWKTVGIVLLFLFFIIFVPFILNYIYKIVPSCDFLNLKYDLSSILEYYGSILAFMGTVILGGVTIYQNHIAQEKADEVNRLTLELQKKSMAMAEQSYQKGNFNEINTPKFELKNDSCNGRYMNLNVSLKNVSTFIVSGIKSVSFEVWAESNNIITTSDKVKSDFYSLLSGQTTQVHFNNQELSIDSVNPQQGGYMRESIKNIDLIWSFQCEDPYGKTHYYKAKLFVADSNRFTGDLWEVEKVG